jgi:hypothetical protein
MKSLRLLSILVLLLALAIVSSCAKVAPYFGNQDTPVGSVFPVPSNALNSDVGNPTASTLPGSGLRPPATNINSNNVGKINQVDFTTSNYMVFAWNNLGMHCANPTYDTAIILPPYNNLRAQVIKRGNPPQIITQDIRVDYSFVNNTYSYGKGDYAQFWDNSKRCSALPYRKIPV